MHTWFWNYTGKGAEINTLSSVFIRDFPVAKILNEMCQSSLTVLWWQWNLVGFPPKKEGFGNIRWFSL